MGRHANDNSWGDDTQEFDEGDVPTLSHPFHQFPTAEDKVEDTRPFADQVGEKVALIITVLIFAGCAILVLSILAAIGVGIWRLFT